MSSHQSNIIDSRHNFSFPGFKPRRFLLLLIAVVVLAGVLVLVLRPATEPEYKGKRLSEWLEQAHRVNYISPEDPGFYHVFVFHGPSLALHVPVEAADAIFKAGTNAIPYLLAWIRYEPSAWKGKARTEINRLLPSALIDHKALRADCAVWAFRILGVKAKSAVPSLAMLMNDDRATNTADRATLILSELASKLPAAGLALLTNNSAGVRLDAVRKLRLAGPLPKSAFAALPGIMHSVQEKDAELAEAAANVLPFHISLLTNNSVSIRLISVRKLAGASLKTLQPALPEVIHCLQDKDAEIAEAAAKVLGRAELEPDLVVPALTASLQRPVVRRSAITALGAFGVQARPAVPALVVLLNDPVPLIRKLATNVLLKIDPQALEKAVAQ